jgi:hypothetical protein
MSQTRYIYVTIRRVKWALEPGLGGWVRFRPDEGAPVLVRFRPTNDGRVEARELFVTSEDRLDSNGLRAIPLGQLEAMANAPHIRDALSRSVGEDEAVEDRAALADAKLQDWLDSIFPVQTVEAPLIENLGQVFTPTITQRRPRLRIAVPKGHKYPDDFYRRVAAAYSYLAGQTRRPAVELAARNDLPVTAVHRWIKEARRRGLLGPGRRGSAG